jgi:hypothetical protein
MDDDRRRRFVLQAMDERTGAPCLEALLWIADLPELRSVLADEAQDDPHLRRAYELTPNQLAAVGSLAEPPFSPDQRLDRLEPWHWLREAPYLVHTGYELALMIEGRKPLAVFGDVYPTDWLDETTSRFDLFVEQRRFVRKIVDKPLLARYPLARTDAGDIFRTVLVALADQSWRIDAYLSMEEARTGWNERLERLQGTLLGYEEWQNDWWIEHARRPPPPTGA